MSDKEEYQSSSEDVSSQHEAEEECVDDQIPVASWQNSDDNTPPVPPSPAAHTVPSPPVEPEVSNIIAEFEKAAMEHITDEEYWDNLMSRAKEMKLIPDPPLQFNSKDTDERTLFGAVKANKINIVEELLEEGEDPNQQNENGTYAMHFACIKNFLTVAKLLKQHGAAVDVQNHAGLTPLHCAVDVGGSMKLCVWLVANGAEVDAASGTGKTPLHCTCLQGFTDIAQWLIKKGANPVAQTTDGSFPVHFACHRGSMDLVDLLLEHGASLDVVNHNGETPFMWACDRGHLELVTALKEKGVNVFARCNLGHTALHFAALNGHIDVVIYLVQSCDLDVNATDNDMGTALHCACQRGHLEVAMWLAERAALNIVTSSRVTLLHSACDGGNIQIVEMLCDKGLDPGAKDIDMRTPLHYAAYRGHTAVVEWFHNNFENVDLLMRVSNKRGSNCLHVACQKGHLELVKYLIACGVPIDCQNNSGNTPLHMASENGHIALAKWLADHGAKLWV
mmetsp:Transcript_8753/g.13078  ORF Transcript_8753/g.13078 Transcript_8753/m.13078 type:complete len:506 (+) Transcript_8753:68-1585(+)|eukprot:CAMPEP_0185030636 /NCGR_PEP_ID=MMETSP1103-20130426/17615_1 /TAXON_ID=36769 /ORGANISM="Paraphysomonas bandaiensis, Strain Caron Lab Isolate" /LENGTH=505 /DNA_ID=CAMNT_0027565841 /DNA_START=26 /DNA_END=1543 /DNA_ORIENTATION=-